MQTEKFYVILFLRFVKESISYGQGYCKSKKINYNFIYFLLMHCVYMLRNFGISCSDGQERRDSNFMVCRHNESYFKLMFPKLGGLGGGMPHHAQYRDAIIAKLGEIR